MKDVHKCYSTTAMHTEIYPVVVQLLYYVVATVFLFLLQVSLTCFV